MNRKSKDIPPLVRPIIESMITRKSGNAITVTTKASAITANDSKFFSFQIDQSSYILSVEVMLLQAKFALVVGNFNETTKLFEQARINATEFGLSYYRPHSQNLE